MRGVKKAVSLNYTVALRGPAVWSRQRANCELGTRRTIFGPEKARCRCISEKLTFVVAQRVIRPKTNFDVSKVCKPKRERARKSSGLIFPDGKTQFYHGNRLSKGYTSDYLYSLCAYIHLYIRRYTYTKAEKKKKNIRASRNIDFWSRTRPRYKILNWMRGVFVALT